MNISIIITCYNRELYVSRAIRSAVSQRFPRQDFEVIVVDDGSKDHSREIIKDFGDDVHAIFHGKNQGLSFARNTGIRKAKGRFVLHLDSDDYMHDDLLYISYLHLTMNPDWGAAACDYFLVDRSERHLERRSAARDPIACGILFRKDTLLSIGLYDPKMRVCEDEELRIRYAQKYKVGNVALPLYRYTKHETNLTSDLEAMKTARRRIAKKHAGINGTPLSKKPIHPSIPPPPSLPTFEKAPTRRKSRKP